MPYGNQNGPSMESAKQEKYDLLHDNPHGLQNILNQACHH